MRSEPRHAAKLVKEQPQPQSQSQRRTFLDLLAMELRRTFGFAAEVVMREGGLVLYVADGEPMRSRSVEIGCDMTHEGWWFAWISGDGRAIAPAEEIVGTACVIARELRVSKAVGSPKWRGCP